MSNPVEPGVRKRVRDAISKLIWDQVTPWVYMNDDGVRVTSHDGQSLSFPDKESPGAKDLFWSGTYIEPFVTEICHQEIAATCRWADAQGVPRRQALSELRTELLAGFIRLYWTMADVHRQTWWKLPNGAVRRDTSGEVDRMMTFLDAALAKAANGAVASA
ncbi:hypothetical protein SAMN02745126_01012 [Enhydrobacter aerosaccus]|uniref:Uncharacterized protein n=1 Tax=Enhydrobacter aerosaccus TaxID=225324 RepID=A0A1T4KJZ8_9HYPH|nr:hypothetical protein [Enhydrobacter aerosaccus]SJZ42724.1 hypothetical protein SAMN02745126_01012 [Enhydrobacter aerosaccus]